MPQNTYRDFYDMLQSQISDLRQEHHLEVANLRNKLDFVEKEKGDALANGEKAKVEIERIKETYNNENEKRKEEWKQIETEHSERLAIMDCFDGICVF